MEKDTAFLFSPADFLIGTMFMTEQQVGIYINLLCAQHQHSGIIDKKYFNEKVKDHPLIREKFKEDSRGFYNVRLNESVKEYRELLRKEAAFKKKQKENISKRWSDTKVIPNLYQTDTTTHTKPIPTTIPNRYPRARRSSSSSKNISNNKNKMFIIPKEEEVIKYFIEKGYKEEVAKRAFLYYSEMEWHDSKGTPIKSWKGKMVSVWFKEENRIFTPGKVNLTQMSNERKNHTS